DHKDLAQKLIDFLSLDPPAQERMGLASRRKAEVEFDEQIVVGRYLAAIEDAIGRRDLRATADASTSPCNRRGWRW
ncbi:MAG: hypothetical protein WBQ49_02865, partial [Rhodomicrobium sp.]